MTTIEIQLLAALAHSNWGVRAAAAGNPNATEQAFRQAAIDEDKHVRQVVAQTARASTVAKIVGALGG